MLFPTLSLPYFSYLLYPGIIDLISYILQLPGLRLYPLVTYDIISLLTLLVLMYLDIYPLVTMNIYELSYLIRTILLTLIIPVIIL